MNRDIHWNRTKTVVIVNPKAGTRSNPINLADLAAQKLRLAGSNVTIVPTERPGHAAEIAAGESERQVDRIIVVGGDGTLRETVEGLGARANEVPIGLVPIGRANVVAREVGIPLTLNDSIDALSDVRARLLDVGRVNRRLFLAMVGVGFDAAVVSGIGCVRKTRLGAAFYNRGGADLVYGLAGLAALLRLFPTRVCLDVDGCRLPGTFATVTVCNCERYALGWSMVPSARPDDGRLDYQACPWSAPPFVLWTLFSSMRRRRVPAFVSSYGAGIRCRIEADRAFSWQADGDPMPATDRLEIDIAPSKITLLIPRGYHP